MTISYQYTNVDGSYSLSVKLPPAPLGGGEAFRLGDAAVLECGFSDLCPFLAGEVVPGAGIFGLEAHLRLPVGLAELVVAPLEQHLERLQAVVLVGVGVFGVCQFLDVLVGVVGGDVRGVAVVSIPDPAVELVHP